MRHAVPGVRGFDGGWLTFAMTSCGIGPNREFHVIRAISDLGPHSSRGIIHEAMPVATPPPAYSAAQVQAAAARRLKPQAAITRKVQAKKKKGKWQLNTFVPGVDGVTYEEFTPEQQGNQLSSFAAFPDRNVILRARGQTRDKGAIAHEMGHILSRYLTDENKKNFMEIMGFQPGEWNTGTGATAGGLKSPNEFFADYYSSVVNRVDPRRQSIAAYAHDINRKRLRRFAIALAEMGRYNQLGAYKEPDWGTWQ